jgi:hypothetical protein
MVSGERSRSVIAGAIANRMFDGPSGQHEETSLFAGSPFRLGYAAIGPLVTGYILWLGRRAKQDGVSKLYFLSREGKLLQEVYETLYSNSNLFIPSAYLYASRRATRIAAIKTEKDIPAIASQPYSKGVILANLLKNRFGIHKSDIPEDIFKMSNFKSIDMKMSSDINEKNDFIDLCVLLKKQILIKSAAERTTYITYLASMGIGKELSPAVVDIGWNANMQGSLGQLLGKSLSGYYYATLQGAERWSNNGHKINAYAGESISKETNNIIIKNRHLIEFLTCHSEASLESMIQVASKFVPLFRQENDHCVRKYFIDDVHRGAIDFARDLQNRLGKLLTYIHIDSSLAERVISNFIAAPTIHDAQLLAGFRFEDSFGGVSDNFLIAPSISYNSIWKEGFDVLERHRESELLNQNLNSSKVHFKKNELKDLLIFRLLIKIERQLIKLFISKHKFQKYLKNRNKFFSDSKIKIVQYWWRLTYYCDDENYCDDEKI